MPFIYPMCNCEDKPCCGCDLEPIWVDDLEWEDYCHEDEVDF